MPRSTTGPSLRIFLICLAVAAIAIVADQTEWFETLEMKTVDARFRVRHWLKSGRAQVRVSDQVVLVGIDQKSVDPTVSRFADRWGSGGWLTREHWISALQYLAAYDQPRVVSYDILFQPNRKPVRTVSTPGTKNGVDQPLVELIRNSKRSLKELINEELFPRTELLNSFDEVCNNRFASQFFNLADQRGAGQPVPEFVIAYNFMGGIFDSAKPWDLNQAADQDQIENLKCHVLPADCVRNIPPDYPFAGNAALPFDELASAPVRLGFINVPRDPDGNIRRIPLVWGFQDPSDGNTRRFAPSLALQACLLHLGIRPETLTSSTGESGLTVELGREIHLWNKTAHIHIPIDDRGRLFLNFEGKIADFPQVPYVGVCDYGELLDREAKGARFNTDLARQELKEAHRIRDLLRGRITLVGQTFTGAGDIGPCAVDSNAPFVFIHMTAIDNILRGSFLRPVGKAGEALLIGLLLLGVWYLGTHCTARTAGLGSAGLFMGVEGAAYGLFHCNVLCLPTILPGLSILVALGAVSLYRYETEQKARLEIRKKFSAMVSDVVLHYLEEHPESFSLAGERREATIFFSDVAGFTSISEKLTPAQLVEVLNAYLGPMSDIIKAHRGCVNKFAGDGIMAFWGAPFPSTDHAVQACLAALEQQRKVREIVPAFRKTCGVDLVVRMGINTGVVSAGGMGSMDRREYTVMGDTVNFAARLEPTNKDYNTRILIGGQTYAEAKEQIIARQLDRIVVKGKTEPVTVYELVGRQGEVSIQQMEGIQLFEEGLQFYWKQEWSQALASFENAIRRLPGDTASQVFIERTKQFQVDPPPPGWQGEYVRTKKD